MRILFFILFLISNDLFANETDTIIVDHLTKPYLSELKYFNVSLKSSGIKQSICFLGLNLESCILASQVPQKQINKIQFFSSDTLLWELTNLKDTNFVWLLAKKKYEKRDTLRFSESKKTKKIEMEEVYDGYKYLNPIGIVIKTNSIDFDLANSIPTVLFFSGKKFIFALKRVTKIVIHK